MRPTSLTGCNRSLNGFAYLFLLFLIALTSLFSALAMEVHSTTIKRERERELLFIGREFVAALERYYNQPIVGIESQIPPSVPTGAASLTSATQRELDLRRFPISVDDLLNDRRSGTVKHHLRRLYLDPFTGKSDWVLIQVQGRIVGFHSNSSDSALKTSDAETAFLRNTDSSYSSWKFIHPLGIALVAQN